MKLIPAGVWGAGLQGSHIRASVIEYNKVYAYRVEPLGPKGLAAIDGDAYVCASGD